MSRDASGRFIKTHGLIKSSTYKTWQAMKDRCKFERKKNYFGRGITYCERWESFENFLADMGDRPPGMTLDRIDNNGNYEPENCRWATVKTQSNNHSANVFLKFEDRTHTIAEWSLITGIGHSTLCERLRRGWSIEKTLTTSVQQQRKSYEKNTVTC